MNYPARNSGQMESPISIVSKRQDEGILRAPVTGVSPGAPVTRLSHRHNLAGFETQLTMITHRLFEKSHDRATVMVPVQDGM